jgi:hypothetical protein
MMSMHLVEKTEIEVAGQGVRKEANERENFIELSWSICL